MTARDDTTIFALSSGQPPAGIAIIRISGPDAGTALRTLAGPLPQPRRATLRTLRDRGEILDRALVLWLPGPATATGEDMAELHLHGGRAVIAGIEQALAGKPDLRRADAGEFTRRALYNGRIDLSAAEGLADLLAAETASQRRAALLVQSGGLTRLFEGWRSQLLEIAARVEGSIDLAEEVDAAAGGLPLSELSTLHDDIAHRLAQPPAERLKDGIRVVLAGPANSGKSSLLNKLVGRDAAIATPTAGTTRDVLEVPIAIAGMPFLFVDTAGLRETHDPIEAEGIARANQAMLSADIVLWLGDEPPPSLQGVMVLALHARADIPGRVADDMTRIPVSVMKRNGIDCLHDALRDAATRLLPRDGEAALAARHRLLLGSIRTELAACARQDDVVLFAEHLRRARALCDQLTGRGNIEDVLDTMFARFCVGK